MNSDAIKTLVTFMVIAAIQQSEVTPADIEIISRSCDYKARDYKKNRAATRLWITRREELGFSTHINKEFENEDPVEYCETFRLPPETFNWLHDIIEAKYWNKKSTNCGVPIPLKTALQLTLRYIIEGTSYRVLSHEYRVSKPYVSVTVPLVCDAISKALYMHLKLPKYEDEWREIADS
jgi:hypothetical protein